MTFTQIEELKKTSKIGRNSGKNTEYI